MKAKSQVTLVKRVFLTFLLAGFVSLFLFSCERKEEAQATTETGPTQVEMALASRDSMIEDLLSAFDKVDANLEIIREKEGKLREYAEGEEVMGNREDRIVRDIQVINTLMAENKEEIGNLRERLRKAGINMNSLEARLNQMELANQEKTAELEDLKVQLASAETNIAGLHDTLSTKEVRIAMQEEVITGQSSVIKDQDTKLHEAYVATGSYKELKERGLVDKEGGILGIGAKKEFTANTDPGEFVTIDQREQVKIPIFSKKAELVTPHPAGSYELEEGADGEVTSLEILNPNAFWQSSRYLIVATND
jgi:hypothetical protein